MFEDFNEVVCLGMGGSYSEIAKDKLFKAYDLFLYQISLNSITECIDYIDENSNAIAILPVETTAKGIIRETIDNLITTKNQNIQILAETSKRLHSFQNNGVLQHFRAHIQPECACQVQNVYKRRNAKTVKCGNCRKHGRICKIAA